MLRESKVLVLSGWIAAALIAGLAIGAAWSSVSGKPGALPAAWAKGSTAAPDIEQAFTRVVDSMQPAVVAITATRTFRHPRSGFQLPGGRRFRFRFDGEGFERFFGEDGEDEDDSIQQQGLGSGVIVDPDGTILTNNHVVAGADELLVHLADKRSVPAELVGRDPKTDVAVIRIKADKLTAAPLGDSDALKVGQFVLAFGSPFGLSQTVTAGIVSAKGRAGMGVADYEEFIQTDAAINQGNSGGPLVNLRGEVVGINTAILSGGGGYDGVGFAIPSNMVRTLMTRIVETGGVERGWLGVYIQDLSPELAKERSYPEREGVLIQGVVEGGPAVKAGDIVRSADELIPESVAGFRNRISQLEAGKTVQVKLWREGKWLTLPVTIGKLPEERSTRH